MQIVGRQPYRPIILIFGLLPIVFPRTAHSQCANPSTATVAIELASLPYAGMPSVLRVSDYYASGAAIGTAQASITGTHIDVIQTNDVAPTLPTVTCRVQFLNVGTLSVGNYDVTWTTTENITIPFPATNTRIRTLTFTILPATAIPAANDRVMIVLAISLATVGALRLARGTPGCQTLSSGRRRERATRRVRRRGECRLSQGFCCRQFEASEDYHRRYRPRKSPGWTTLFKEQRPETQQLGARASRANDLEPGFQIFTLMGDRENDEFVLLDDIEQCVRKPNQTFAADFRREHTGSSWKPFEKCDCRANLGDELVTETRSGSVVVIHVLREVSSGLLVESGLQFRFRASSFANTSSAGKERAFPALRSEYRRSASATQP